ncbi:MAG: hypothetical protein IT375_35850 [Polyangiaceae bacterium]|nr:hypothetical protein [Polyangiaceae bacterium]
MRWPLFLALGLVVLSACGGSRQKPAESAPAEYSDQQEYANTPTHGPASSSSHGYYGTGSSGAPERTPATPGR